jgi:hypothetical protein
MIHNSFTLRLYLAGIFSAGILYRKSVFFVRITAPATSLKPSLSMDAESTARINQAVDAVLEICTGSPLPHSLLRDFLKAAKDQGSLSTEELAAVESAVLRALDSQ